VKIINRKRCSTPFYHPALHSLPAPLTKHFISLKT